MYFSFDATCVLYDWIFVKPGHVRYQVSAHSLLGSTDIWAGASKNKKETKRGDLREQNHQKPNGTIAKACGVIEFKALLTLYLFMLK